MARRAPRFQVEVDYIPAPNGVDICYNISVTPGLGLDYYPTPNQVRVDSNPTPNKARQFSKIKCLLDIHTFLEGYNGCLEFQSATLYSWVFSESEFGSNQHRNSVARYLLQAGWLSQVSLDSTLDLAFFNAKLILENEKKNPSNNEFCGKIIIKFRVKKIVRRDNDVARAMELSMREDPKLVPATKESIEALPKVKLEDEVNRDCMICMEKLVSVATCMPCSHLFHGYCIAKWLNNSHLCPLCRFPMPTNV